MKDELSTDELAALLGCSAETVRELTRRHVLAKVGKSSRLRRRPARCGEFAGGFGGGGSAAGCRVSRRSARVWLRCRESARNSSSSKSVRNGCGSKCSTAICGRIRAGIATKCGECRIVARRRPDRCGAGEVRDRSVPHEIATGTDLPQELRGEDNDGAPI